MHAVSFTTTVVTASGDLVNRETNRQTDRQTNVTKNKNPCYADSGNRLCSESANLRQRQNFNQK